MTIIKRIADFIGKAFQGVSGALAVAAELAVDIKAAVVTYGPMLRQHVRDAAETVEALIPDGLPESKLRAFDDMLKWYIARDKALPKDLSLDTPEVQAAVRLLLETYLADKKAKAAQ
jgi:hypothetical protein